MIEIIEKIVICAICGGLNAWGGYNWHNARRFIMPLVLVFGVSLFTHVLWSGLLVLPVVGTLCLGYFSDKNWGRALWVFMQAVMIGLGLYLFGYISAFLYFPYVVGAGILGGNYKNWNQIIGDRSEERRVGKEC